MIFLDEFGTLQTVWYFLLSLFFHYYMNAGRTDINIHPIAVTHYNASLYSTKTGMF